jgi:hypothetical protein
LISSSTVATASTTGISVSVVPIELETVPVQDKPFQEQPCTIPQDALPRLSYILQLVWVTGVAGVGPLSQKSPFQEQPVSKLQAALLLLYELQLSAWFRRAVFPNAIKGTHTSIYKQISFAVITPINCVKKSYEQLCLAQKKRGRILAYTKGKSLGH